MNAVAERTAKSAAMETISQMPEDATFEDIFEALALRSRIAEGLKDLDEGRGVPHEDVRARMSKWLT